MHNVLSRVLLSCILICEAGSKADLDRVPNEVLFFPAHALRGTLVTGSTCSKSLRAAFRCFVKPAVVCAGDEK
jgi:hypothetical protein